MSQSCDSNGIASLSLTLTTSKTTCIVTGQNESVHLDHNSQRGTMHSSEVAAMHGIQLASLAEDSSLLQSLHGSDLGSKRSHDSHDEQSFGSFTRSGLRLQPCLTSSSLRITPSKSKGSNFCSSLQLSTSRGMKFVTSFQKRGGEPLRACVVLIPPLANLLTVLFRRLSPSILSTC